MRLIHDNIFENSTCHFLVELGCREVHIPRYDLARFDQGLGHDVFSSSSLVRRDDVVVTQYLLEFLQELEVVTVVERVCPPS